MNGVISGEEGRKFRLSEAFHIGPSYFKTLEYNNKKFNRDDVFNKEIEPILREYVRPYDTSKQDDFIKKCKGALNGEDKGKAKDNNTAADSDSSTDTVEG